MAAAFDLSVPQTMEKLASVSVKRIEKLQTQQVIW
jgi:hypothetical protein